MGTVKDRNSMNLEEAVYIKNKWQGYTEGLNKKYLNDQITMMVWSLT